MTYLKQNINHNEIYKNSYWSDNASDSAPLDYMRLGFLRGVYIARSLKKRKIYPKNILDIGSGPGAVSLGFLNECKNDVKINIIDKSKNARQSCKDLGFKTYESLEDMFLLQKEKKIDLIMLVHILEHFKNPVDFISYLKQNFAKGTVLYMQVPNGKWHQSAEIFHETIWHTKSIKKFLDMMNFTKSEVWHDSNPFQKSKPIYTHILCEIGSDKNYKKVKHNIFDPFFSYCYRLNSLLYNTLWQPHKMRPYRFWKMFSKKIKNQHAYDEVMRELKGKDL